MHYLTAHRVDGRQGAGINAWLYRAEPQLARAADGTVDISQAVETEGLAVVAAAVEVTPGGNQIPSFLDVVFEDGDDEYVEKALADARQQIAQSSPPYVAATFEGVGVQFNLNMGLYDHAVDEFDALAASATALLSGGGRWSQEPAVVISAAAGEHKATFRLVHGAKELAGAGLPSTQPASVSIDYDTWSDFDTYVGAIWPQVAMLLTGLDLEQLSALGGVRFVREGSEDVIKEWPERAA
jgi:hypothetical protein